MKWFLVGVMAGILLTPVTVFVVMIVDYLRNGSRQ